MTNKAKDPCLSVTKYIETAALEDNFTFVFKNKRFDAPIENLDLPVIHQLLYKLIWIKEGVGSHFIDSNEYPLQAGQVFLMAPEQIHKWKDDAQFSGISCVFSEELFDDSYQTKTVKTSGFFDQLGKSKLISVPDDKKKLLCHLAHILKSEAQDSKCNLNIIRPLFMAFLYAFTYLENSQYNKPTKLDPLIELTNLIDNHYHKENSGCFYANKLDISIKQLNILVKERYGKTVSGLIQDRLLLAAKRNLILSHDSVKTIAYQLGFEDPSYFSRFFRRYMGCSPNQYRTKFQPVNISQESIY